MNAKQFGFSLLVVVPLCSSCVRNTVVVQSSGAAQRSVECPVYASQYWHAWIDQLDQTAGKGRLNISGQLELPSPGYSIEYSVGPLDRRNPPSLRVNLLLKPPKDDVIQVITTQDLRYSLSTDTLRYKSISVTCGDRQLVEMIDVIPIE